MTDLMRTTTAGADPRRACNRKKAYTDEKLAKRVAAKVREKSGDDVVAYGCTLCGQYHIGHRSSRER